MSKSEASLVEAKPASSNETHMEYETHMDLSSRVFFVSKTVFNVELLNQISLSAFLTPIFFLV